MNSKFLLATLFFFAFTISKGQTVISKPNFIIIDADSKTKEKLLSSIDSLFLGIDQNKIDTTLIKYDNRKLSIAILKGLKGNENSEKDSIKNHYKRQLINLYPISNSDYFVSVAYIGSKNSEPPVLKTIFNLTAHIEKEKIVFSIPTLYYTKNWKSKTIGNIRYQFGDNFNVENAKLFDKKNTEIATKFGLKPEKINFYLCDNYQEVLRLLGFGYDIESNGETNNGYGVVANTIFAVKHNEDFSHDLFHYYSTKIRTNGRNWYAEEGFAYCWGNAYWTNKNGETITQKQLVFQLQDYINTKPQTSLLELFDKEPIIFEPLSDEIRLKKILSSLICHEVEQRTGIIGVKDLLNCGNGADNFFKKTDQLVHINRLNFDTEVMKLLMGFK